MDTPKTIAKRLLEGTVWCASVNAENSTFFSAQLITTRNVALLMSVQENPDKRLKTTLKTALTPSKINFETLCFTCPYRAIGWAIKALLKNASCSLDNDAHENLQNRSPLIITRGPRNIEDCLNNAIKFAEAATEHTLTKNKFGTLTYIVNVAGKSAIGVYIEFHHARFAIATTDGTKKLLTVPYAEQESVNEALGTWTLTAVSQWTECQLCLQLTLFLKESIQTNWQSSIPERMAAAFKTIQRV